MLLERKNIEKKICNDVMSIFGHPRFPWFRSIESIKILRSEILLVLPLWRLPRSNKLSECVTRTTTEYPLRRCLGNFASGRNWTILTNLPANTMTWLYSWPGSWPTVFNFRNRFVASCSLFFHFFFFFSERTCVKILDKIAAKLSAWLSSAECAPRDRLVRLLKTMAWQLPSLSLTK